jgi:nitric oxide reductase subunit B
MAAVPPQVDDRAEDRIDRGLRWGLFGVVVVALAILAAGTVVVARGAPPIPERVVAADGSTLFTRADIVAGKAIFQRTDLMDFGSLYGNGAYFGPDWTADYLHREALSVGDTLALGLYGSPYASLTGTEQARIDTAVSSTLKTNRLADGTLPLPDAEAAAYRQIRASYRDLFTAGDRTLGLQPGTVRSTGEADQLTAFLSWAAWTTVANRPGETASYTNNWPYEPLVGNVATGAMWTWTWISLAALVVGAAVLVVVYRRLLGGPAARVHAPPSPASPNPPGAAETADEPATSSQGATGKWFLIVPVILIVQGLLGALMAHAYAERSSFFGLDVGSILPFNVLKGWHLQFAIAWIAAAWLGAGLYLAPVIGGREPRHQRALVNLLWAAVVLVVGGSAVGLWLGVKVDLGDAWFWIGNQGLEYIQLGRLYQIALFGGLVLWAIVLLRAFWPGLRQARRWGSLEALLLYSGASIGIVYAFGMLPLTAIESSPTMTDYWRWWVVHLWVENTFEFFTIVAIGWALLRLGLLSRRLVERIVYLELILIFGSGIIGTGHHFYWVGEPAMWLALGSFFSMLEVLPLGLLIVRAWQEYRAIRAAGEAFPQRAAFYYFTSASAWNFIGAGFIGGVINPPIVSYFEHGTFLTSTHGHASLFGAFGLLALGLLYLCLRGLVPSARWSDRSAVRALWAFNAAIVLWLVFNLFPVGAAQLEAVIDEGYAWARSVAFYDGVTIFAWLRLPGDIAYLIGGGIVLADVVAKLRARRAASVTEGPAGARVRAPAPTGA